jgi:acetoacetate decarboxylase
MTRDEILGASSMPLASPSYPKGSFRFINREYLLIHYETDPEALRAFLPEPLEPDGNDVFFEWMKMPDSTGFGDYQENGCGIAALYNGEKCNYSVMMYLDDEALTTGGREIWGFPKKYGEPELKVIHDDADRHALLRRGACGAGYHGVQAEGAGPCQGHRRHEETEHQSEMDS